MTIEELIVVQQPAAGLAVLSAIAKATDESADKLLIGLHGWGANAADLAVIADYMPLQGFKMLFPDGPFPHPHAPGGRMWYGFPMGYDFQSKHDFEQQADLQESRQLLRQWLAKVADETGIPPERTAIAGFPRRGNDAGCGAATTAGWGFDPQWLFAQYAGTPY